MCPVKSGLSGREDGAAWTPMILTFGFFFAEKSADTDDCACCSAHRKEVIDISVGIAPNFGTCCLVMVFLVCFVYGLTCIIPTVFLCDALDSVNQVVEDKTRLFKILDFVDVVKRVNVESVTFENFCPLLGSFRFEIGNEFESFGVSDSRVAACDIDKRIALFDKAFLFAVLDKGEREPVLNASCRVQVFELSDDMRFDSVLFLVIGKFNWRRVANEFCNGLVNFRYEILL